MVDKIRAGEQPSPCLGDLANDDARLPADSPFFKIAPQDVIDAVNESKQNILAGEIEVPLVNDVKAHD